MYTAKDVAKRIIDLCREKGISLNELSRVSKVPTFAINSILDGSDQDPGIVTIKKICEGMGIELIEFFK